MNRDFAFLKGKDLGTLRIHDPFALKSPFNADCVQRLLEQLSSLWRSFPKEIFLRAREPEPSPQTATLETVLRKYVDSKGSKFALYKVPSYGPKRRDFHDRRLVFATSAQKPVRTEVLLTGGVDRYVEPRFETSLVVRRA